MLNCPVCSANLELISTRQDKAAQTRNPLLQRVIEWLDTPKPLGELLVANAVKGNLMVYGDTDEVVYRTAFRGIDFLRATGTPMHYHALARVLVDLPGWTAKPVRMSVFGVQGLFYQRLGFEGYMGAVPEDIFDDTASLI